MDHHQNNNQTSTTTFQGESWKPCFCSESTDNKIDNILGGSNTNESSRTVVGGCEHSAILHHGSYLRFGCLQFAFTMMDSATENHPTSLNNVSKQPAESPAKSELDDRDAPEDAKSIPSDVEVVSSQDGEENDTPMLAKGNCEQESQPMSEEMEIDP